MTYCKFCGKELEDDAVFCSKCGAHVEAEQYQSTNDFQSIIPKIEDSGHIAWGLLGFLVPIVGLILFLIWKDEKPKTSLMAGKGALISVILSIATTVLFFILFAIFGIASM